MPKPIKDALFDWFYRLNGSIERYDSQINDLRTELSSLEAEREQYLMQRDELSTLLGDTLGWTDERTVKN